MRLLNLEIKRILKSRYTVCIVLVAIVLSIILAYIPLVFFHCVNPSSEGPDYYTGIEALQELKRIRKDIEGEITQEDIEETVRNYQMCMNSYGVRHEYELPIEGKREVAKLQFLYYRIREAYGPENGTAADIMNLPTEGLADFYLSVHTHLKNNMVLEQENFPAAQENAIKMYSKVDIPFTYYVGINTSAIDYEGLLILMILLCSTAIVAPVFSTEYQTGADDILRCTRDGRRKLATIKIYSSIIISLGLCILCLSLWGIMILLIWGKPGMKTSIQILYSVISLVNGNIGQLIWMLGISGIIMIISSTCLTLFISSKVSKNMIALILSYVVCFLPMAIGWVLPNNIADYLKVIFPTGGIGLQNGILYDIIDFKFLNIGSFSIWTPYLIILMAVLEIPLWILLTIRSYSKHISH